jgi:hypothetical protein
MNDSTALAEYKKHVQSKVVALVMMAIGIGPVIFGLVTLSSPETSRTALAIGLGGLLFVGGLATLIDSIRGEKLDERLRVFGDRLERVTSAGVERFPFADLARLEGKVVLVQKTGTRYHSFRLSFGSKQIELTGGGLYDGVDEETGRVLTRATGKSMEPWL